MRVAVVVTSSTHTMCTSTRTGIHTATRTSTTSTMKDRPRRVRAMVRAREIVSLAHCMRRLDGSNGLRLVHVHLAARRGASNDCCVVRS